MTSTTPRPPIKLYPGDVVRRKKAPQDMAIVLRCWHSLEEDPPMPRQEGAEASRPLTLGEIAVSFVMSLPQDEFLYSQDEFELVDRNFQPGDVCKKDLQAVESGMVVLAEVEAKLQHAITGVALEGWVPAAALEPASEIFVNAYVVLDDWVGKIVEIFSEAIVELTGGGLVRVPEISARLQVGDRGPSVLPSPEGAAPSFMASLILSHARASYNDTVLSVKPTALAISWLAINQSLEPAVAASRSRPPQFFSGPEMSRLRLIRSRLTAVPHFGERFIWRDPSTALANSLAPSVHGKEGVDGGTITVNVLAVRETRTRVTVVWQDGHKEVCMSTELLPYENSDEYECWPGDYVVHKADDLKRVAVVQSINSKDRIARIRYSDDGSIELVSGLELDPQGTSLLGPAQPDSQRDNFAVRRGDFVFVHREGSTNGAEFPRIPTIGELEPWAGERPTVLNKPDGTTTFIGWRGELHNIGHAIAKARGTPQALGKVLDGCLKPMTKVGGVDWFGQVTDLATDGNIEVTLGNTDVVLVPLHRLTRLLHVDDTVMMDMWDDGYSDGYGGEEDGEIEIQYDIGAQGGGGGAWQPYVPDPLTNDEWEDVIDLDEWDSVPEDADSVARIPLGTPSSASKRINPMFIVPAPLPLPQLPHTTIPTQSQTQIQPFVDSTQTPPAPSPSGTLSPTPAPTPAPTLAPTPAPAVADVAKKAKELSDEDEDNATWQRFAILSQAPLDHAFYSAERAQTTRAFMTRLNKEYKVLRSTLPDSILVRAYEDRADLLRSLIIGPENTPYENAPFVIDWRLGSEFPHMPPQAHFHSWTNGNGRVNPNLYEEGKVCLSILGTWSGDKNETWNAARSSLLQAFVSIQGLVLVKEPWYLEPAFEKFRNTEDGMVDSRLYNEKAYVLSRGFVRRALEIPLGGLESEINWFYYEHGRLQDVINEARELVRKSTTEDALDDHLSPSSSAAALMPTTDPAVPRLTAGGCLMLSRTLAKLETLLESYRTRTHAPDTCKVSSSEGKS